MPSPLGFLDMNVVGTVAISLTFLTVYVFPSNFPSTRYVLPSSIYNLSPNAQPLERAVFISL